MPGLKRFYPDFTFSGNKVAPSETDWYRQYHICLPQVGTASVGTVITGGTSLSGAFVIFTPIADYPRNLELNLTGTANGLGGTAVINGKNQFGAVITETIGVVGTLNGGTTAGTKVFAKVTNGTFTYGTSLGGGTATLGWGTQGTTTLFGIPDKLGGTADVINVTLASALTGGSSIANGTVGSLVNLTQNAIHLNLPLTGTNFINVMYRPSYDSSNESNNAVTTPIG